MVKKKSKRRKKTTAKDFAKQRPGPGPCRTCLEPWKGLIKDVLEEWLRQGEGYSNLSALHRWLGEDHGYTLTYDAMWKHLHNHEKELSSQVLQTKQRS